MGQSALRGLWVIDGAEQSVAHSLDPGHNPSPVETHTACMIMHIRPEEPKFRGYTRGQERDFPHKVPASSALLLAPLSGKMEEGGGGR